MIVWKTYVPCRVRPKNIPDFARCSHVSTATDLHIARKREQNYWTFNGQINPPRVSTSEIIVSPPWYCTVYYCCPQKSCEFRSKSGYLKKLACDETASCRPASRFRAEALWQPKKPSEFYFKIHIMFTRQPYVMWNRLLIFTKYVFIRLLISHMQTSIIWWWYLQSLWPFLSFLYGFVGMES